MNKRISVTIGLVLLVTILFVTTGCSLENLDVGPVQTDTETIELGAAESVTAEINLGAGSLAIGSGATALMDGTFTYNVANWKPEVDYQVSGVKGTLTVEQPDAKGSIPLNVDDVRYEWELRFNNDVPLGLNINMGAGEGELDLSDLLLDSLVFEGGAGDVNIDLSSASLTDLEVTLGAGDVSLDLSGNWQEDLTAAIKGGIGKVTLLLPVNIGVRVEAQGGLGAINAAGLNKDGNVYTNDAYGESAVTLDIEVEGGVGEINLQLAE
jgi:hypothetical protein